MNYIYRILKKVNKIFIKTDETSLRQLDTMLVYKPKLGGQEKEQGNEQLDPCLLPIPSLTLITT